MSDGMVAGRELNQKIAVEVMGWRITHRGHRVAPGEDHKYQTEIGGFTSEADCLKWISQQCADYSGDWRAAGSVIEKLRADGYALELYSPGALVNDEFGMVAKRWEASFKAWEGGTIGPEAEADTAPLAISLAALAAVGALPTPTEE